MTWGFPLSCTPTDFPPHPASSLPPSCSFFIYRDPDSGQWSMFPWDVESGAPPHEAVGRVAV